MKQAPRWTAAEFEQLLKNPQASDEELAAMLPQRSVGAVGAVRAGVHSYHTDKKFASTALSRMMHDRLAKGPHVTCSVCGATI